jgi:hypothetical protein
MKWFSGGVVISGSLRATEKPLPSMLFRSLGEAGRVVYGPLLDLRPPRVVDLRFAACVCAVVVPEAVELGGADSESVGCLGKRWRG